MEKHTKVVCEKEKTINFEELNDYIKWLIKDSILSARKNRDCTQEALAEEINVSAKTMQAYELDGKTGRIPKTTQFLYMAAVIDINLNELRDEIKGKIKELSTHCRYDMIPSSRTQKYKNLLGGILCPEKVKLMQ